MWWLPFLLLFVSLSFLYLNYSPLQYSTRPFSYSCARKQGRNWCTLIRIDLTVYSQTKERYPGGYCEGLFVCWLLVGRKRVLVGRVSVSLVLVWLPFSNRTKKRCGWVTLQFYSQSFRRRSPTELEDNGNEKFRV